MIEKDKNPPMIQILPMDKDDKEFNEDRVQKVQQDFFLKKLPDKKGKYLYKKHGISPVKGSLILFQYDNVIIAKAVFDYREKFLEPIVEYDAEYNGALFFEPSSITIFDDPIKNKEMNKIWTDLRGFSNVKSILSTENGEYLKFKELRSISTNKFYYFFNLFFRLLPHNLPRNLVSSVCLLVKL